MLCSLILMIILFILEASADSDFSSTEADIELIPVDMTPLMTGYPVKKRIIGGVEANATNNRYVAAVYYSLNLICGGSLIAKNFVLTVAHCIKVDATEGYMVRLGTIDEEDKGTKIKVILIMIHPKYKKDPESRYLFDAALMQLEEDVPEKSSISVIRLATNSNYENSTCTVSGWGSTDTKVDTNEDPMNQETIEEGRSATSSHLMTANQSIIPDKECTSILKKHSPRDTLHIKSQLCANGSGHPCISDIGNGLVCEDFLVGMVSWNLPCSSDLPGIYTRVSVIADWVQAAVKASTATCSWKINYLFLLRCILTALLCSLSGIHCFS